MNRDSLPLLRALCWAEHHMTETIEGCGHLLAQGKIETHLERCLATGIIVSYVRPFMQNDGLAQLNSRFGSFTDSAMGKLHRALIEARNISYGHTDVKTEPKDLALSLTSEQRQKIGIHLDESGRARWFLLQNSLPVEYFPHVIKLAEFQKERLHQASTEMLQHLCKGRAFRPGTYTLGIDFPDPAE